ncbi:hypothetical protein [Salmonella enterica]|uniref:hypothetical protein n=1 Tax=Salmonella enterica TaxID=28901 RepID=UPI0021B163E5|nr:hypothetical protein [Salmonella enterica]MCT6989442.1 hypothetical protein [Salmonella enterica subsp. enterica serovar Give]
MNNPFFIKCLKDSEETNHAPGKAARVNSYWKPDVCPVTGRQFFMWIEHETLGYVPTYGGPFDSYTIPTRDSSGEFSCERYDHDVGGWVEGETIGLYLIDDDEQCRGVNSYWKPDVCPVTGRQFFMWIEHETLGYVPTYGGPFDSYTIPTRDSSGEFSCERYDHDLGGWVGGEFIGLYLIDDDEQCRVCELEERIAELEAREVTLPPTFWYEHDDLSRDIPVLDKRLVKKAIRAAGIKVKES